MYNMHLKKIGLRTISCIIIVWATFSNCACLAQNKVSGKKIAANRNRYVDEPRLSQVTGGLTPEALGKVMLIAIKTDNKKLWENSIHPITAMAGNRQYISDSFDYVRNELEQAGVTQWNQLVFSRVRFYYDIPGGMGKDDKGVFQAGLYAGDEVYKGESIRRMFELEFTYQNKNFVGKIGGIAIMTYKNKMFMMLNPSTASMERL